MLTLCFLLLLAADWLTDGGNPQRTSWQKDEKILNKDNVKNLKIVWKLQLDNEPKEMHSLFPPLITGNIAIVAGTGDNIYAIDVATAKILWKKHFEYPTPKRRGRPTDPLCPAGLTATPVIQKGIIYALAGDGEIHALKVADGEDVAPPFQFGYPYGKSYALNLWNDVLFTTTAQGCAGCHGGSR